VNVDRGATSYFDYEQTAFSPQHNSIYALYTVRWICRNSDRPYDYSQQKKDDKAPEYNTEFGHWINVSPGSTITAQGSPFGPCQCVTKKDKNSKKEPPTPDAQENDRFLNNGGTDWDNNGGPGSSTSELFPQNDQSSPFNSSPSRWKND